MAKEKWNVSVPIKYGDDNEKTYWHNVGNAFKNDKGFFVVYLNSLPLPGVDGKCTFMIFPPKEDDDREESRGRRAGDSKSKGSRKPKTLAEDMDDEIPF